jgi:hypothetical protein
VSNQFTSSSPIPIAAGGHDNCECLQGVEFSPSESRVWTPKSIGVFDAAALEEAFLKLEVPGDVFTNDALDDAIRKIDQPYAAKLKIPPYFRTIKYLRNRNAILRQDLRQHQISMRELRKTLQEANIVIEKMYKLVDIHIKELKTYL